MMPFLSTSVCSHSTESSKRLRLANGQYFGQQREEKKMRGINLCGHLLLVPLLLLWQVTVALH